jgi:glycopeptide antibiotics resistance protein
MLNLEPAWNDGLVHERLARALDPAIHWSDAIDGLRNVLLFAGFGAVWEATSTQARLRDALVRATIYGFLLSVTVETLQLFSPVRFSSVLDVFTNTFGAFIGALGIGLLVAAVRARRDSRSYLGLPMFVVALGQLGAVAMEGATPLFRQERLPVGGGPLSRLRQAIAMAEPVSIWTMPLTELVLSVPAGFLSVAALAEFGIERWTAVGIVAAIALPLSLIAEAAHGATGEVMSWGAMVAHGGGIIAGAAIAAAALPAITQRYRGVARARAFAVAYVVTLAVWSWRPFIPRTSFSEVVADFALGHWIPMSALAVRGDVFTVGHVIQLFALAMPLGALLAAWPVRHTGWWRWILPAIWLFAAFEIGHAFIAERMFDITNFLILVAGAWMGWWILRRAGVPERGMLG